jgi:hypothetical protein
VTRLWASPTSTTAGNLRYSRVLNFFFAVTSRQATSFLTWMLLIIVLSQELRRMTAEGFCRICTNSYVYPAIVEGGVELQACRPPFAFSHWNQLKRRKQPWRRSLLPYCLPTGGQRFNTRPTPIASQRPYQLTCRVLLVQSVAAITTAASIQLPALSPAHTLIIRDIADKTSPDHDVSHRRRQQEKVHNRRQINPTSPPRNHIHAIFNGRYLISNRTSSSSAQHVSPPRIDIRHELHHFPSSVSLYFINRTWRMEHSHSLFAIGE